jgi:hypothetical protein
MPSLPSLTRIGHLLAQRKSSWIQEARGASALPA